MPLIEVNCSALPESLAESELFGHERGAFTDARTARMGLFEAASGGTLFLDELPSLSVALQAKVLTVLEDHRLRRVGANKNIPLEVRVIAATNRDLQALVAAGEFREDLYHRLDLYRVHIPPLRERGQDILELADIFTRKICRRHRLPQKRLTEAGKQRLLSYRWPGNVRELAHELERTIVFSDGEDLSFDHLHFPHEHGGETFRPEDWFNENYRFPPEGFCLPKAINRIIHHALRQTQNNLSAAARLLGVPRDYLRYRLSREATGAEQEKHEPVPG
jgi:DNA-binding NtrC family response regulator